VGRGGRRCSGQAGAAAAAGGGRHGVECKCASCHARDALQPRRSADGRDDGVAGGAAAATAAAAAAVVAAAAAVAALVAAAAAAAGDGPAALRGTLPPDYRVYEEDCDELRRSMHVETWLNGSLR
jgi:hypothetical protein